MRLQDLLNVPEQNVYVPVTRGHRINAVVQRAIEDDHVTDAEVRDILGSAGFYVDKYEAHVIRSLRENVGDNSLTAENRTTAQENLRAWELRNEPYRIMNAMGRATERLSPTAKLLVGALTFPVVGPILLAEILIERAVRAASAR